MISLNFNAEAIKQLPKWLAAAKIWWWFLFLLFAVWFVADWIGVAVDANREDRIRYAGWMFEILGLLAVAFGLNKKLDLLDQKGIRERIRDWWRSCPLFRYDVEAAITGVAILGVGGNLRARLRGLIRENAPLDVKVKFLLEAYERLDDELHNLSGQQREDFKQLMAEIKKIEVRLSDEIKDVASKYAKAQTSDIGWEIAGLGWVVIGVTLATMPDLILMMF